MADFAPKSTSTPTVDENDPDYWKKVIPASMIEANDKSKEEVTIYCCKRLIKSSQRWYLVHGRRN